MYMLFVYKTQELFLTNSALRSKLSHNTLSHCMEIEGRDFIYKGGVISEPALLIISLSQETPTVSGPHTATTAVKNILSVVL